MSDEQENTIAEADGSAEATAVAEIMRASAVPVVLTLSDTADDGVEHEVLAMPDGKGGFTLDLSSDVLAPLRAAPIRRMGAAKLTDLASFIRHVQRFKDEDTAIFAKEDAAAPALTAVLNYHRKGADGVARFGDHRAVYAFAVSDEWKA